MKMFKFDIRKAMQDVLKEIETKVGDISPELVRKVDGLKETKEALDAEIEKRTTEFAKRMQDEFNPRMTAIEDENELIWKEIFKEFKIPEEEQENHYTINQENELILIKRGEDDLEPSKYPVQ